jgi:uncharacterized membrane protein
VDTVRRDGPSGRPLVVLQPAGLVPALDLAVNQIRQYGRGDVAVLLRLSRALSHVADVTDRPAHVAAIRAHVAKLRIVAGALPEHDREELDARLGRLWARVKGPAP